jgi:hypothetical protein
MSTAYRIKLDGFIETYKKVGIKHWNRHRYGRLQLDSNEMDEYVFYTNVGSEMSDIMKGLAFANGGVVRNGLL